jgi:catechol 2,3-dioxygenase-like lactoylglutathione lyase family enzyme
MAFLDHLTIFVRDLARSREWYMTVLDLKLEFEVPAHQTTALQDSAGFTLFLEQRPAQQCTQSCVVTFRVDAVESMCQSLIANGIEIERPPQKLFWGFGAELHDFS